MNETNQMNQINQINKTNQINQINQTDRASRRKRIVPIYEYQCEDCTDKFEVKQSMNDDPLTTCPRCGKRIQRLISSPAIMFKGSGWYVTDYSDKMKPSPDSEAPTPAAGEKKEAAPGTSDQTTPTAPSTPAPSPASAPASTPPSTSSTTSSTTTTAPSSTSTKKTGETEAR